MKKVMLPLTEKEMKNLHAGDGVLLSGEMFTARDAAHKRLIELLNNEQPLPVNLQNATVYYVGPCPTPPGKIVGSCGPTTAARCDSYTPELLKQGLKGMVGKGYRSQEVVNSIKQNGAVYFVAIGGAAALYADCVKECSIIAFDDLGAEAIHKFVVEDFPVVVAVDSQGNSIY
jgi:fumarate hydratase subunit beta